MASEVITNIFAYWEQVGVFSYIIPFLLIFALVFGILMRMGLFKENKAVSAIIALAVGLMALQFDFVPRFFSEIFPRFGIGLAIILITLILVGMFTDPSKPGLMYLFLGIGVVITIVILVQTSSALGSNVGTWIQQNWGSSLAAIGIIILVIVAIAAVLGVKPKKTDYKAPIFKFSQD
jgi:hypothetical protein